MHKDAAQVHVLAKQIQGNALGRSHKRSRSLSVLLRFMLQCAPTSRSCLRLSPTHSQSRPCCILASIA